MKMTALSCLFLALAALPATAGEAIFGLGVDDALDRRASSAAAAVFEYHFDPFYEAARFRASPAVAVQTDSDGAWWAGAGVAFMRDLRSGWFIGGSLMAGYYRQGSGGTDLGSDFEFRTLGQTMNSHATQSHTTPNNEFTRQTVIYYFKQ